jgi:PAS domain-containing protein
MFRYSDLSNQHPGTADFIRRKRHGGVLKAFVIYFLLLIALVTYIFVRNYHNKDIVLVILLTVALSTLILHALYSIQKSLDLIMEVEFQNALFTSALNLRVDFTIIMQRNGSIVYVDHGFRNMFPEVRAIDDKVLDYLTENLRMDARAKERFFNAIRNYDFEQIMVEVARGEGKYDKYMLYMSPLPRPKGFFMIQARPYVEMRNASDVNMGPMVSGIPSQAMLDALPSSAYMMDDSGNVTYCNPEFAQMLGYRTAEEYIQNTSHIAKLVSRPDALFANQKPQTFDGTLDLIGSEGPAIRVNVFQNPVIEDNKIIGAVGLVQRMG